MAPRDEVVHMQLKDAVYAQILEKIVDGTLPAGYPLREGELAARFGVSKTPLRDALVRLQADGADIKSADGQSRTFRRKRCFCPTFNF